MRNIGKNQLLCLLLQVFVLGLIVGTILFHPATAIAGAVSLTWDANLEEDLFGYKMYVGTSPGTYSEVVTVGWVTAITLYNLSVGQKYFFAVTAYDWSLNESDFSNEVSTTIISKPPRASFNYWCSNLICSFTDTSTDSDGSVTAWSWNFGEGGSSTQQSPEHAYASDGTYTVDLSVFDDDGGTDTTLKGVTARSIRLSAVGYKVKGLQKVDLSWDGAMSASVEIYRDGSKVTTIGNDGSYTDNIDKKGRGTYTYQVCEEGTPTCSNQSTVGKTDTSSQDGSGDGTVTCSSVGIITLSAVGYKVKGLQKVDLSWDGAMSASVEIYRDGSKVTTIGNDGSYTDNIDKKGGGTYTYQVSEEGTSNCSNQSTVTF